MTFIPTHAQQLVIIQWMDSCIPKEEEEMYLPVSPLLFARKIVSDDSWHIPGFLSTLSNC
jgi:hypothetical protein